MATALAGIRADHVARYAWAAARLQNACVIDAACGCGYGSALMIDRGVWYVHGLDKSEEALAFANKNWRRTAIAYWPVDLGSLNVFPPADAVVSFETIEHLENPVPFLKTARATATSLLASVPNEDVMPKGSRFPFHHRHYTPQDFEALLYRTGWFIKSWWGQLGPESPVEPNVVGRTIVVEAS